MDLGRYRRWFADLTVAWLVFQDGVVLENNRALRDLLGVGEDRPVAGARLTELFGRRFHERLRALLDTGEPVSPVTALVSRPDGRDVWVETACSLTDLDGRPAVHVLLLDVTAWVDQEQRLVRDALHDPLTGLPNRLLLERRWATLVDGWTDLDRAPALLFCNVDRFKAVNDAHGTSTATRHCARSPVICALRCVLTTCSAAMAATSSWRCFLWERRPSPTSSRSASAPFCNLPSTPRGG